jgi:DNA-binding NarL/FixJ family response regulator
MPNMNGLDALKAIRAVKPDAKVIILTTLVGDVQVYRAFQYGAIGYLLKNLLQDELADTVRAAMKGQKRMPPEIAADIALHATDEDLTERELSVLRAISKGCSNKIIGAELGISEHTIKNHVQTILAKLRANDRTHAVTIALQRGFIEM